MGAKIINNKESEAYLDVSVIEGNGIEGLYN